MQGLSKYVEGNAGALTFLIKLEHHIQWAKQDYILKFFHEKDISGSKLYMFWNDCTQQ